MMEDGKDLIKRREDRGLQKFKLNSRLIEGRAMQRREEDHEYEKGC